MTVDKDEVVNELITERDIDPNKAHDIADEYENLVVVQGFDEGETALEIAMYTIREGFKEVEEDRSSFERVNNQASIYAERKAQKGADKYGEDLNIGTEDFVETAKSKIDKVEDTVEETDWDEVQAELERRIQNNLLKEDVKREVRNAIYKHANYDYSETEVNEFANEIIEYVAQNKATEISNRLVREMETGDIESEEDTIQDTVESMFVSRSIGGFTAGVGQSLGKAVTNEGVRTIGAIIGSAIAGGAFYML